LPFDQDLKRKTVVRADGADPKMCRVYVKGAPEEIIPLCTQTLNIDGQPKNFQQSHGKAILKIVSE
jgi:magnesium-transporting ATPase (P-type)